MKGHLKSINKPFASIIIASPVKYLHGAVFILYLQLENWADREVLIPINSTNSNNATPFACCSSLYRSIETYSAMAK